MNKGTALLRHQNEKRTLTMLRNQKYSSRQEIAKTLGLSKNTISLIVDKFLKDGIVKEIGIDEQGGVGRPRIQLSLVTDIYKAIGILIQNSFCQYVVTDYCSNILEDGHLQIDGNHPDGCIDELILLCKRLLEKHPEVLGIGLAVPALVDPVMGIVHFSSHLSWRNIHLKERMDRELLVKTKVLNNVKASAIAPSSVIPQENLSNSFYLRIDEGVGGAHIVDSQIYSGASWTAGEVGHLPMDANGPLCTCGQKGCLESLVSIPAIIKRIQTHDPQFGLDGNLQQLLAEEWNKDSFIEQIIRQSGEYVGTAVSQIITLLNPKYIVIDSPFEKLETFRNAVKTSMESRTLKYPLEKTNLLFVTNQYSSSVGAAFAVILDFERG
jgi:predicted NBD/HSP70 family sugar kinase/biotin operon repressor